MFSDPDEAMIATTVTKLKAVYERCHHTNAHPWIQAPQRIDLQYLYTTLTMTVSVLNRSSFALPYVYCKIPSEQSIPIQILIPHPYPLWKMSAKYIL